MPSKPKRARTAISLPLIPEFTKQFFKDWQTLQHSGRYDMARLKNVIIKLLANDSALDPIHREHQLHGKWAGRLECHVGGDLLIIYERSATSIVFERAGSHTTLFES